MKASAECPLLLTRWEPTTLGVVSRGSTRKRRYPIGSSRRLCRLRWDRSKTAIGVPYLEIPETRVPYLGRGSQIASALRIPYLHLFLHISHTVGPYVQA